MLEDDDGFLRQLLEGSRDAFAVVTPDGEVALANAAARSLLRLPATGGRLPSDDCVFLASDGRPLDPAALPWKRAAAGERVHATAMAVSCQNRTTSLEVTAAPLQEPDGTVIGAAMTLSLYAADTVRQLREGRARAELLRDAALAAASAGDLGELTSRVLETLAARTGLLAGVVRVLSADGEELRPGATYLRDTRTAEEMVPLAREAAGTFMDRAFREGRVLTHEDWAPRTSDAGRSSAIRFIALPIEFEGRSIGSLSLAFEGRRSFTDSEVELYRGIAHVLGHGAESARRLEAEQETTKRAEGELEVSAMLLETAERLARPLEIGDVLDALADSLVRLTRRRRVLVVMLDQRTSRFVVRAVRGAPARLVGTVGPLARLSDAVRAILAAGTSQPTLDELPATDEQRTLMRSQGVARPLVIPIVRHKRILGAAIVDEPGSAAPFSEREIRIAESVAQLAAAVIENARSYESQHRIAETLQETLLLMPDRVDGVTFGTLYRSATQAARVGGDFYDLFEVGERRVALVVGDVSGKGLDAASVTALARNAVRIHASEGLGPSQVMEKTSEVLHRFTSAETFVTAFFGVLELETGVLTYVSAGHPEGIIVGKGGYVCQLKAESPLLGALEGITFAEHVALLAPSDTLFVYTDGVTEARRGNEWYGTDRLAEFLGSLADNDPKAIPAHVLAEIEAFSEGRLRDDVAMLAVRRDEVPDPMRRVAGETALPATRVVRDPGDDSVVGAEPRVRGEWDRPLRG